MKAMIMAFHAYLNIRTHTDGMLRSRLHVQCTVIQLAIATLEFPGYKKLYCHTLNLLTLKVLVATIDAQWEGMGDVGSARYEPALLPPCPTIRVLSYSNY